MGYPVYSERVLYSEVANAWRAVTVPENYRLVIKCITAANNSAAPGAVVVSTHGYLVVADPLPANSSLVRVDLQIVVYERESIAAIVTSSASSVSIHGFLFADTGERIEFPPALERDFPLPAPLPVAAAAA